MGRHPLPGIDITRLNSFRRVGESIPRVVQPFCEDALIIDRDNGAENTVELSKELITICQAKIVVATCSTAGGLFRLSLPTVHFSHVLVDEAGYASEPETWIPLCVAGLGSKIVLAGDPKQLGPVLSSKFSEEQGLGRSMIERLMATSKPYQRDDANFENQGGYNPNYVTKLTENYRSHADY
jgi:superfamily I DNA and/or RNA helicase